MDSQQGEGSDGHRNAVAFAFLAGLTFIAVIALFAVWTSVCPIEAAVGRKLRSLKEPYQWFVVPEVQEIERCN